MREGMSHFTVLKPTELLSPVVRLKTSFVDFEKE
jgi:hypothetical protein